MNTWFRNHFYLIFFGIFALVGTGMGLGGVYFWLERVRVSHDGIHTEGTVVDLVRSSEGNTQAPVVQFYLRQGGIQTYTSNIFSSPPAYEIGESVELWYNPANPDEVVLSGMDSWFLPLFFGIFFLVFGGVGYGGLFYHLLKKRDIQWLETNGAPIQATFTGVLLNTSITVNGASPYVVQGQWLDPATNRLYVFRSDNIWYDPTEWVTQKTLRVLIDPKNPGLYHVDLSFLPERAN